MTLKTATLAPIPRISEINITEEGPRRRANVRSAYLRLRNREVNRLFLRQRMQNEPSAGVGIVAGS